MSKIIVVAIVAGVVVSFAARATGQDMEAPLVLDERSEADYYRPQPPRYEPDTRAIIQQKAMRRAEQRQARLEARSWHEWGTSRPTISTGWGYVYGEHQMLMPLGRFRRPRAPQTNVAVSTGLDSAQIRANAGALAERPSQYIR